MYFPFFPKNCRPVFIIFHLFFKYLFRFLLSSVAKNEMVNDRSWTDPLEISADTPLSFYLIRSKWSGAARESKSSKQNEKKKKAQRSWSTAHSQLSIVFLHKKYGGTHQRRFQWKITRRRDWAVVSNSSRHRQPIVTENNIMDLFIIYIIISLKKALGIFQSMERPQGQQQCTIFYLHNVKILSPQLFFNQ